MAGLLESNSDTMSFYIFKNMTLSGNIPNLSKDKAWDQLEARGKATKQDLARAFQSCLSQQQTTRSVVYKICESNAWSSRSRAIFSGFGSMHSRTRKGKPTSIP